MIGAFAIAAPGAQAADFQVNSLADGPSDACDATCTLRDAVDAATATNADDLITFQSGLSGTITLTQGVLAAVDNEYKLEIRGPGAGAITVSGDADGSGTRTAGDTRILATNSPAAGFELAISGLTLSDGYGSNGIAGAIITNGPTTITGVVFSGNTAADDAGTGTGEGGGAIFTSGVTTITGSTFDGNRSAPGGGGAVSSRAALTISESEFRDNAAATVGGAVEARTGTVTISDSEFADNGAGAGGGAIRTSGTLSVSGSELTGNEAAGNGGAVEATGDLTLSDSELTGNDSGGRGGAVTFSSKYSDATISDSAISGNSADVAGGGLYLAARPPGPKYVPPDLGQDIVVERSTVADNDGGVGGGIFVNRVAANDALNITQSTVSGNEATGLGGGIIFGGGTGGEGVDGDARVVNSTVSGNTANAGAGVDVEAVTAVGELAFDNMTIARNTATHNGGGARIGYMVNAPVGLTSTIVADNTVAGTPDDLFRPASATTGSFATSFSLVEAPGTAPLTQTPAGSTQLGVDPALSPLADNGGLTQTHLPSAASAAIDTGSSPPALTVDQRDMPRRVDLPPANAGDGTDVGSVERSAEPSPGPGPGPQAAVAPDTTITKGPKKKLVTKGKKATVRIEFASNVGGARFECKVGGGPYRACSSPLKLRLASRPGKGRFHQVSIRAIAPDGTVEQQPARVGVRVTRSD